MLATSLSRDLYARFLRPEAADARLLRVARGAAVAGGAGATALAIVLTSIIEALSIFYTLLSVSLFVPVIVGLYVGRCGPPRPSPRSRPASPFSLRFGSRPATAASGG